MALGTRLASCRGFGARMSNEEQSFTGRTRSAWRPDHRLTCRCTKQRTPETNSTWYDR